MAIWTKNTASAVQQQQEKQQELIGAAAAAEAMYRSSLVGSPSGLYGVWDGQSTVGGRPIGQKEIDYASGRKRMIAMRLHIPEGETVPFDFLETHLYKETVFVYVSVDGKNVILEDDAALFPSDTLITQLRLIQK